MKVKFFGHGIRKKGKSDREKIKKGSHLKEIKLIKHTYTIFYNFTYYRSFCVFIGFSFFPEINLPNKPKRN